MTSFKAQIVPYCLLDLKTESYYQPESSDVCQFLLKLN